jgi:hypothetical protein
VVCQGGLYDALMPAQLYTPVKPAARYRGVVVTGFFLCVACVLAQSLVSGRARKPFVPRLVVPGWDVSFAPPVGFVQGDPVRKPYGVAIPFFGQTADGREVTCVVYRLSGWKDAAGSDPLAQIVGEGRTADFGAVPSTQPAQLGAFPAVEAQVPADAPRLLVRAGLTPDGPAYAVSISINHGRLGPDERSAFEQVCDSFRLER